jgi:glycosyltransferase involved in cell wall biosynthesis
LDIGEYVDKKIRILYIVSTLGRSGPTNQLFGLVENLDCKKYAITILTLSKEPKDSRRDDFINLGVEVKSLSLSRIAFQLMPKNIIKRHIVDFNADIIHTSGLRADDLVSKLGFMSKHCTTIHNFAKDDYIPEYGKIIGGWAVKKCLKVMENCQYVVCCSKSIKSKYQKIVSNNLFAVQNGVDVNRYFPSKNIKAKREVKKKLNMPIDQKIFIMSGVLIARKDPIMVINAFKKANQNNSAKLFVLGDGELLKDCQMAANDSIVFTGKVSNVNDYLMASDVYISASKAEGLPYSVLEAARCGLDMILSDIMPHKEIFEGEKFARLFEVGNVSKLTKEIALILQRDQIKINYDLSNYIEKKFSGKAMADNYNLIYDMIIERKNSAIE